MVFCLFLLNMNIFNIILGILMFPLGFLLINLTAKIERKTQEPSLYSKLGIVGIGILILGAYLIITEMIKIF